MPEENGNPGEEWLDDVREAYHAPPETPRDEMWAAIEARLGPEAEGSASNVVSLEVEREARVRLRVDAQVVEAGEDCQGAVP